MDNPLGLIRREDGPDTGGRPRTDGRENAARVASSRSEGLRAVNTTERLRAAAATSAVSREMAENLEDAMEFIASLRVNHQADQISRGEPADNYLPPKDLSELERKHLKDAFKVIQEMQETLDHRYQLACFR